MKRSFQIDRRRENNLWKVNNIKERERVSKQRDYLTTSDATARQGKGEWKDLNYPVTRRPFLALAAEVSEQYWGTIIVL